MKVIPPHAISCGKVWGGAMFALLLPPDRTNKKQGYLVDEKWIRISQKSGVRKN